MPSMLAAPAALATARLCGAAAWLHVQDFEVDAAFELGLLRGGSARSWIERCERKLLRSFDVVSTISNAMVDRLQQKGIDRAQCALVPNGVDVRSIRPSSPAAGLRREIGLREDQRVCLFAGTMNRKQGIHVVIEAARALQHRDDIVFVLSGDGELRPALEQAAMGLGNIRFHGLCPPQVLNELLNLADVHLLPQLRNAADLVMPSKLTGMLASGRPVVAGAAAGTEIARVIEGRGALVEPECAASLAAAVQSLCDDDGMRLRLGEAARRYAVEQLDQVRLFDDLDAALHRIAGTQTTATPRPALV
jgi:colanic acid biosynthesis glycosyl transferase WcaI